MLGRLGPVARLVEEASLDADHAIAADDPFVPPIAQRLRAAKFSRDLARGSRSAEP